MYLSECSFHQLIVNCTLSQITGQSSAMFYKQSAFRFFYILKQQLLGAKICNFKLYHKVFTMVEIKNKVADSGIVSIDMESFITQGERVVFDIRPCLFNDLILREKEFREFVKTNPWDLYRDKIVGIVCSADAIVPTWAYMLVALALEPFAKRVFFADSREIDTLLFAETISKLNPEQFRNARVVVKGCSDTKIPVNAYVQLSTLLKPYVKSIMYGEPCSTVPLFKAKV